MNQYVLIKLSSTLARSMAVGNGVIIVDKHMFEEDGWMLVHRFDSDKKAVDESTVSLYLKVDL